MLPRASRIGRHAHERAEVVGLALERLRDVRHGAVIVVVEIARGGAGVPAFRPVRQERDSLIEDFERVGIAFDPDRLPSPLKQKVAGVGTGFGIEVQKPADDARGLVSILGGGEPRIEIGALFRGRFRGRLVLFRLRPFVCGAWPSGLPGAAGLSGLSCGAAGGSAARAEAPAKRTASAKLAKTDCAERRMAGIYGARQRPKKGPRAETVYPCRAL